MTDNIAKHLAAICGVVALSVVGVFGQSNSAHADEQQFIRSYMEDLRRDGTVNVSGTHVYARAMGEIYAAHEFEPIWDDMDQVDELLARSKTFRWMAWIHKT